MTFNFGIQERNMKLVLELGEQAWVISHMFAILVLFAILGPLHILGIWWQATKKIWMRWRVIYQFVRLMSWLENCYFSFSINNISLLIQCGFVFLRENNNLQKTGDIAVIISTINKQHMLLPKHFHHNLSHNFTLSQTYFELSELTVWWAELTIMLLLLLSV